jgi:hypothetical protein
VTDRQEPTGTPEPPETPEVAEVRRLLAQARHDEPMPDDLAARLDDVLAGLGAETPETASAPADDARVVPIPVRRRRNAAGLLVAAAAIVVGGIVIAPHVHVGSASDRSSAGAAGGAAAGSDNQLHGASSPTQPRSAEGTNQLVSGRVVVRPRHFATDAARAMVLLRHPPADTAKARSAPCSGLPPHATSVPAAYRRAPAALVYGPVEGSSRVVDLYVCGSSRPVRSTTLSLR